MIRRRISHKSNKKEKLISISFVGVHNEEPRYLRDIRSLEDVYSDT